MRTVKNLIIGSGLSGLIMAYLLRRESTLVLERQKQKDMDKAQPFFYLHSEVDWFPTIWKQIDVFHNCWDGEFHRQPNIGMMNDYAKKITGKIINTSLKFMNGDNMNGFVPANGSPTQLMADLKEEMGDRIEYGSAVSKIAARLHIAITAEGEEIQYESLINTIPLKHLLTMLGWQQKISLKADPIYIKQYDLGDGMAHEVYQVVYITAPQYRAYRTSLLHNRIVVESMSEMSDEDTAAILAGVWDMSVSDLKLSKSFTLFPGKFHPVDGLKRKMLLSKLTTEFNIFSLGRYATWSYKRLDHVAPDAKAILKMMKVKEAACGH